MYIILIEQMMNVHSRERFTFTYCGSSVALIKKLKSIASWFEFFCVCNLGQRKVYRFYWH